MSRPLVFAMLPLVIFTDVCYTAYLNSFYMDAAALCALLLMTAAAVWMTAPPAPRTVPVVIFGFRGAPVCHLESAARRMGFPARRDAARMRIPLEAESRAGLECGSPGAAGGRSHAGFDRCLVSRAGDVQRSVLPPRPAGVDLQRSGVQSRGTSLSRHARLHARCARGRSRLDRGVWHGEPASPACSGGTLRHPVSTLGFLAETLRDGAPEMRPVNLSNFRAADGRLRVRGPRRFALWSNWRSGAAAPLALAHGGRGTSFSWPAAWRAGSPLKWVAMGIAALGAGRVRGGGAGRLAGCRPVIYSSSMPPPI